MNTIPYPTSRTIHRKDPADTPPTSCGALNIHLISTFLGSLLVLTLWTQATALAPALAFVITFGAISGAIIGLPPASVAYILHHSPVPASNYGGPAPAQDTSALGDAATVGESSADLESERTTIASSKLGQWTGMMYTFSAAFALIGPVIAGHLVKQYHRNYLTVQLWSGFCLLLCAVCMGVGRVCVGRGGRRGVVVSGVGGEDGKDEGREEAEGEGREKAEGGMSGEREGKSGKC